MDMKIRPNDTVKHIPSGEKWTVCGINYEQGRLIPCGYPFPSMARIEDCILIKSRNEPQDDDMKYNLKRYGFESFVEIND